VQTTLLGVGIAIILALLAALVGPYFVNWGDYRSVFEAHASRIIGAPIRIAGAIDARLLPVPSVTLRNVEVTPPTAAAPVKAREIGIELALGALVRGEWRVTELRVIEPDVNLGLDGQGRIHWPGSTTGFDPDALLIERVTLEDGRIALADAASGARIVLERFWFNGDARSLAGPLKGEGGFVAGDERHSYRLNAGRLGEEGARFRLSVDAADLQISADADGTLRFDQQGLRFEGALVLSRLQGVTMVRGRAINREPWRIAARVKSSLTGSLFEQLELQYGPEERALKFTGAAELKFDQGVRLDAVLSARQIDLDRLVQLPESAQRLPLMAIKAAADALGDALTPGIPVRLGVGIDTLMLGGAPVQAVRGDFATNSGGWDVESLEFRAPGFAQLRTSGRLTLTREGVSFVGPGSIDATDPRVLAAWIEGREVGAAVPSGALRASGDVTLATERVSIERLSAEIDRKKLSGRLSYAWSTADRRPRLEAEINAAELDLDATTAMIRSALPGATLDMPAEFALSLNLGRVTLMGVEARHAQAKLSLDANGIAFEQLAIGDLAGVAVDLKGAIQGPWTTPHGALTYDLAGARLDGLLRLLEQVAPRVAETLRPVSAQLGPAKLRGTLNVDRAAQATVSTAMARLEGSAGPLRIVVTADVTGDPAAWRQAVLKTEGSAEAEDGRALARLFRLDEALAIAPGPGKFRWTATGPLTGALRFDGRLTAVGADLRAVGTLTVGEDGTSGRADISATASDVTALRAATGRADRPASVTFKARLAFKPGEFAFEDILGTAAGATLNGRLHMVPGTPLRVDGLLDADAFHAVALLAALTGMPSQAAGQGPPRGPAVTWSAQPFGPRLLAGIEGKIEMGASRAALTPNLDIRQFQAVLRFDATEIAVEGVRGTLAGGRLVADVSIPRGAEGTSVDARVALSGADIVGIWPSGARAPVSGRITIQLEAKGSGRSPASLVGALGGAGIISVENIEFAGLDPRVFDTVTRAIDQGVGVENARVKAVVETALAHGRLRVAAADGALTLTAGQIRVNGLLAKGDQADLGISASVDLAQGIVDARLALQGGAVSDGPAAGRPEIHVGLKGNISAPQRSLDVSALVGWLTLRAVDLQARRLEALEAERATAEAARLEAARLEAAKAVQGRPPREQQAAPAPEPLVPASAPPASFPPSFPPIMAPDLVVPPAPPQPSQAAPQAATPPAERAPAALPRRSAPPPVEQAPALPPPIDIRPAPVPRRTGTSQSGTSQPSHAQPRQTAGSGDTRLRPPAAIPPERPRSLFDLFGAAR
jgi:large subunit ribosomal protein L24